MHRLPVASLALAIALAATVAFVPSTADASPTSLSLINQTRDRHGLDPLLTDTTLTAAAGDWLDELIETNSFRHAPMRDIRTARAGWSKVGELVGRGRTASTLHDAFLRSPGHRDALLDGDFTRIGIATGHHRGRLYIVIRLSD